MDSNNSLTAKEATLVASAIDATLVDILKTYYRMCKQTADKQSFIKDSNLMSTLCASVGDTRPQVSLYVCKILMALSKEPENAAVLAANAQLKASISCACEVTSISPQVVRGLLIIQSRMTNADKGPSSNLQSKRAFCNRASKQYVFNFDHPSEAQKRQIERSCLEVVGVVSVCFQPSQSGLKCIVRCRETVDAKDIAEQILASGMYDVVQMLVRLEDGSQQTFNFYSEEETKAVEEMPQYLDENVECFDPTQAIVTNEQLERGHNASSWFSTLKFW